MRETPPLRLLAQDAQDLAVVAAAVQDAVGKVGDIQFEPKTKRLTFAFNRYRWEAEGKAGSRVRCALQLGGVMRVETRKLRRSPRDAVVELLTLAFEPGEEAPGGVVAMTFAGGGDLRAEVECLDAILADVSGAWPSATMPRHED